MVVRLVAVVAAVLVLASCGSSGAGDSGMPSRAPAPTATEDLPTPTPSGRGRTMTLTGTVSAGVEHGCLVLMADGASYTLVGHTEGLEDGDRVVVRGALAPDLATTCQQGRPFRVDEVTRT